MIPLEWAVAIAIAILGCTTTGLHGPGSSLPRCSRRWAVASAQPLVATCPPRRRGTQNSSGRAGRSCGNPGTTLTDYVRMFPSPCARDHRSGKGRKPNGHTPQLCEVLGGLINPTWLELLMGFPEGWTGSALLETPKFRAWRQLHSES